MHLIRNAIAHGIEPPEERARASKAETASIIATCMLEGTTPVILLEDDGRGIDFDSLSTRAGKDPADLLNVRELLFTPGLSTAADVSELAGRGRAWRPCARTYLRLAGTIDVDSARRIGSAFIIRRRRRMSAESPSEGEPSHARTI